MYCVQVYNTLHMMRFKIYFSSQFSVWLNAIPKIVLRPLERFCKIVFFVHSISLDWRVKISTLLSSLLDCEKQVTQSKLVKKNIRKHHQKSTQQQNGTIKHICNFFTFNVLVALVLHLQFNTENNEFAQYFPRIILYTRGIN